MPAKTGTFGVADLIANKQTTPAQFGVDTIAEVLAADLAAHNTVTNNMFTELADVTSGLDRMRLYGASDDTELVEVDEFSRSRTQKTSTGNAAGFPLKLYQYAVGWTRKYMQQATVSDMALRQQAAKKAHVRRLRVEMQRALYRATNYTITDKLVAPQIALPVKRLANADSFGIPNGPNAESYDASTHSHYLASATLTAGALLSLVNTVVEHTTTGGVKVAISAADETAVRALSGFTPFVDSRLTVNMSANQPSAVLNVTVTNNRPIGLFGAAEVWVKPWAIANYALAYDALAAEKPLLRRTRTGGEGLVVAAELDAFPLHAQFMEAEFGFGVWNRVGAAVLQFNSGTYADPV